jgi:selenocysteine-specific elongation factor
MRVIATAGHVDHGKSTVIRALTGMEPDRWAEEQRRGLTIGLGFVWTTLPGVGEVAFVDVPGHEKFVPTMLAGVGPVPAVLFVVAADGGWMPQSDEHLAALDAFGVRHGMLAVTRADLADPAPAMADALTRIGRTSLGELPAVAVSARTGQGLDKLRAALVTLATQVGPGDPAADVRLWIDRTFTIDGAGTVVTGTLAAGTLRVEDQLVLAGSGERVRVRALQSLGKDLDVVVPAARVAVNLRGTARPSVGPGDALLTPDVWRRTDVLDAVLTGDDARQLPRELVLHIGSAAVRVRPRALGPTTTRLRLARPLPLRVGDRVLLRDPGRHRVAARADVLDIDPPDLHRRGAAATRAAELTALAGAPAVEQAEALLRRQRFLAPAGFRIAGLPVVGQPVSVLRADPTALAAALAQLPGTVRTWSADNPLAAGMPLDVLRQALDLPDLATTEHLVRDADLSLADGRVRPAVDPAALPPTLQAAVNTVRADLSSAPFVAPDTNRLAELGLGYQELAAAARAGQLLRVGNGIVLLPDAEQRAAEILATLPAPFTVAQARQALDTTRRVAVPLLELLDRNGITRRLTDGTRHLR